MSKLKPKLQINNHKPADVNTSKMVAANYDDFSLSQDMVDKEYREPYIIYGYRKSGMRFTDCIRSIFNPYCNESFNTLSHGLFGVYFIMKYWKIFTEEFDILDPFVWPLLSFATGMTLLCFMSASAHAFNSMSLHAHYKCFFLDYAAINIYGMGAYQAFYFYSRPVDSNFILFNSSTLFLGIALFNAVFGTYLCCISRTQMGGSLQHLVRACVNSCTYLLTATTVVHRYFFCTSAVDCDGSGWPLYWKHAAFLILAVAFYGSKIPERFVLGKFDCFGSSHNIFHVLVALGMDFKFDFIKYELLSRRSRLLDDVIQPNLYSTIVLMTSTLVINLLICYLVEPNSNKLCKKKDN